MARFQNHFIPTILYCKIKKKTYSREQVKTTHSCVKCNRESLKLRLRLYDVFLTLGCSVAMEHALFKIKYDKYCKSKLNETFLVDQIYDFKSHKVLNFIFVMFDAVDSNIVYVFIFLDDPRI